MICRHFCFVTLFFIISCGNTAAEPELLAAENLGSEAQSQLVALATASFLADKNQGLESFLDSDLEIDRLIPSNLESRPLAAGFRFSSAGDGGKAQSLGEEMDSLRDRLGGQRGFHVKVIEVDAGTDDEGAIRTVQLVELNGESKTGRREIHARWETEWTRSQSGTLQLAQLRVADFQETVYELTPKSPPSLFTDATGAVMVDCGVFSAQFGRGNNGWRDRIEAYNRFFKFGHNGIALGDVDGDGLEDLYACQTGGLPNRLFLQQPDGTVRENAAVAGVDFLDSTRAALFADFDNDGDQDLALGLNGGLMILRNGGDGRFEPVLRYPTVTNGFSMAAADHDLDGDLDLYVCRYYSGNTDGANLAVPVPYFDANNGGENFLLRNEGMGDHWLKFTDATADSGLDVKNTRFSYGVVWEDFDLDGDQDLYVANDFGKNNLYLNSAGKFTDITAEAGLEDGAFGMSAATGDLDGDGFPDLYVGNMFSSAGSRVTRNPAFRGGGDEAYRETFQRLARGNSVYRSLGGKAPRFEDLTASSGASLGRWSWGSVFMDMNNDGYEDIFVANGFFTGRDPDDL